MSAMLVWLSLASVALHLFELSRIDLNRTEFFCQGSVECVRPGTRVSCLNLLPHGVMAAHMDPNQWLLPTPIK